MRKYLTFVLGAADPEMGAIKGLLMGFDPSLRHLITTIHAEAGGRRCHYGNAYRCENGDPGDPDTVWVECSPKDGHSGITADHHRPGDPGWGKPPAEFWAASAIGQVVALLVAHKLMARTRRPQEKEIFAAADHCLTAAYRGECHGVDPDALMRWRIATRASFQRRSVREVESDVECARKRLSEAPEIEALPGVKDIRGPAVPELPEAAARDGVPFLATPPSPDGRRKIVLMAATAEALAAWPAWAAAEGLVDTYGGDPARGFAGGYALA